MDVAKVRKYLEVIRRSADLIEQALSEMPESVEPELAMNTIVKEDGAQANQLDEERARQEAEYQKYLQDRKDHIDKLLAIDCWPPAVPSFLANATVSNQDQANRASAVLDMILGKSIKGATFLDYGCGEGWITAEAKKRGAEATGFDVIGNAKWKDLDATFSSNPDDLQKESFDFVFLYDVLDHSHDPVGVMKHIKSLLKPGGVVYARCHPWPSKYASHLFKVGLNKSYMHLFLGWQELKDLGHEPMFTRPEINPVEAYHWWFHMFKIDKERFIREPVHEFFLVPSFKELLIAEQKLEGERQEGFFKDMEIQFIDYTLYLP